MLRWSTLAPGCVFALRVCVLGVFALGVFVFGSSIAVPSANATLMRAATLRELVRESTDIVRARVVRTESRRVSDGRIVTDAELESTERYFGSLSIGEHFIFRTVGGTVGDVGLRVEGEPYVQVGEDLFLFLHPASFDGERYYRPVGMCQGVFSVAQHQGRTRVESNAVGVSLVAPSPSGLSHAQPALPQPMAWAEWLTRVTALIREEHRP